jgi:hypothetical protein
MSLKGLEYQVSKSVNSDVCPRPTTKDPAVEKAAAKAAARIAQVPDRARRLP